MFGDTSKSGFLSLRSQRFAAGEIIIVMKSGIRAVACDSDALYFFTYRGSGFAWQLQNMDINGWLLTQEGWQRESRFPVSLKALNTHSKLVNEIAPEIDRLSSESHSYRLKNIVAEGTAVLPYPCSSLIIRFLNNIDCREVVSRIVGSDFGNMEGWTLLKIVMKNPEARDLFFQNPALLFLAIKTNYSREPVEKIIQLTRREILRKTGYPDNESIVRILSKLTPPAIKLEFLLDLFQALDEPAMTKMLSHLKRINPDVIRLVSHKPAWPYITGRLLQEMSAYDGICLFSEIKEILQHCNDLPGFKCPVLRSVSAVQNCYQRVMEELNHQARIWRLAGSPFPQPPNVGVDGLLTPVTDFNELERESREMEHCVVTYSEKIRAGRCYVYRLHSPERATICIEHDHPDEKWRINDVRLQCNGVTSTGSMEIVNEWLREWQSDSK